MHRNGIHPDALELAGLLKPTWPKVSARIARSGVPTCEVAEAPLKEKLKTIEAELASAREARVEAVKERDEARDAYAGIEDITPDSKEFKEAEAAVKALGEIDDKIANLQAAQVGTLKMLGKDAPQSAGSRAAGDPSDPRGAAWDSSGLLANEEIRATLAHVATSKGRFGGIELGQVVGRDALAADVTGTSDMRRGDYLGVVPQLRRILRILDLIPTGTMDHNTLPYTQESGSFTTAAETAEGSTKPEGEVVFTDQEAVAATIAHFQKIRKQALADFAALRSIIDSRLRYGVERRLEGQILAGTGEGANIRGILKTSGLGDVPFEAGQLVTDQVLKAITTVLLADAQATGIVLHPNDWQTALLAKAQGDGHYFSGGPFQVTPHVLWGVPLVPSATMSAGTSLVGDFEIGAQLFIREGVNVLLSDSDQDDFVKNRITMLGEMRAALAVFRPAAFATAELK